jgi:AraC-like DNA-binding protein
MQQIPTLHLSDFAPSPAPFPTWQLTDRGQFRAYRLEAFITDLDLAGRYSRKDFLKLTLSQGPATYFCGEERWELAAGQAALVFTPANQPYRWEIPALPCRGYCAVFTASFLAAAGYAPPPGRSLIATPAFSYLSPAQYAELHPLFDQLLAGQASAYPDREELLFHGLMLSLHTLRQLVPPASATSPATASVRLVDAFHCLLAAQFPLLAPSQTLALRTPQAYADRLAVQVNSLNRALKQHTGQSTSQLLSARLLQEARALLRHTDWPISSISSCLGFSEPTHFAAFCRRATGYAPSQLR